MNSLAPQFEHYINLITVDILYTVIFAVPKQEYEKYPEMFPLKPDGIIPGSGIQRECESTKTGFGLVNYVNSEKTNIIGDDSKNTIRGTESKDNCAARCFETAGCTSFTVDDEACRYFIGNGRSGGVTYGDETSISGWIDGSICPVNAFRRSELHTKFVLYVKILEKSQNKISFPDSNFELRL